MMRWKGLSAATLAGAFLASSAVASDVATDPRLDQQLGTSMLDGAIEGQVAAVDRSRGQLLLATAQGLLALRATPDQLADVEVGDTVLVELGDPEDSATDDEPTGFEEPGPGDRI